MEEEKVTRKHIFWFLITTAVAFFTLLVPFVLGLFIVDLDRLKLNPKPPMTPLRYLAAVGIAILIDFSLYLVWINYSPNAAIRMFIGLFLMMIPLGWLKNYMLRKQVSK
jgi:hypothetical protein